MNIFFTVCYNIFSSIYYHIHHTISTFIWLFLRVIRNIKNYSQLQHITGDLITAGKHSNFTVLSLGLPLLEPLPPFLDFESQLFRIFSFLIKCFPLQNSLGPQVGGWVRHSGDPRQSVRRQSSWRPFVFSQSQPLYKMPERNSLDMDCFMRWTTSLELLLSSPFLLCFLFSLTL